MRRFEIVFKREAGSGESDESGVARRKSAIHDEKLIRSALMRFSHHMTFFVSLNAMQWHHLVSDFSPVPAFILSGSIGFSQHVRFLITFCRLELGNSFVRKKKAQILAVGMDIQFITEISHELYQKFIYG